jgi:hypothetical protein
VPVSPSSERTVARPEQNFQNHARMVPGFHYVTAPLLLLYVGWAIARAVTHRDWESHFDLVGAFALAGVYVYCRWFPLRAQDRVIRLEERLRLQALLPDDLKARIPELRASWLIALRFASDEEVAELVRWTLEHRPASQKAIKARIRHWRADHLRV